MVDPIDPNVIETNLIETDFATSSVFGEDRSRSANTRAEIVRKIATMTKQHHNIQKVYKDTLRAVLFLMGNMEYIDREGKVMSIKSHHANPERAIAKIKEKGNIILPVISVSQTNTQNADDRQRYAPVLVHEKYWDDDQRRAIRILSMAPRPIDVYYDVSIWTKYVEDIDQIMEQIRLLFNPSYEIETAKNTLTKAFIDDESNESSFNVGDGQDRIVKRIVTLRVETYVPNPKFLITSTGQIEKFNGEIELYRP